MKRKTKKYQNGGLAKPNTRKMVKSARKSKRAAIKAGADRKATRKSAGTIIKGMKTARKNVRKYNRKNK